MADTNIQVYDPEQAAQFNFNPSEHLMQIKNKGGATDYLPVQWRLVWFRKHCPNGTIRTEMVHLDLNQETEEETYAWNNETRRSEKIVKRAPGIAIFRAVVDDGKGGHAEGTKSEKAASFADFIEKAETGAIGRALAALGYGTQFVGDEFDEGHRIVDAPADLHRTQQNQGTQRREERKELTEAEKEAYQKRRQVVDADPAPAAPSATPSQRQADPAVKPLQKRAGALGLARTPQEWMNYKAGVLGHEVLDADLAKQQIDMLSRDLTEREKKQPAGAKS